MSALETNTDLQEQVLYAFTVLRLARMKWNGALLLNFGLDAQGASVTMAANLAGAVCLSLEPRPEMLKEALHSGACDFVVRTLDEALRTIKNEIRRHKPLSVGLHGSPGDLSEELLKRGVQPEMLIEPATGFCNRLEAQELSRLRSVLQSMQELGASRLYFADSVPRSASQPSSSLVAESLLQPLEQKHWRIRSFLAGNVLQLRAFDAFVLETLGEDEALRRLWLQSIQRMLPQRRPWSRALWVTDAEERQLDEMLVTISLQSPSAAPKAP